MTGWRLYADAGNTALKWAARAGGCWVAEGRMEIAVSVVAWREVGAVLEMAGLDADECEGVALVCSRPSEAEAAEHALTAATGVPVRLMGRDLHSRLRVAYEDPTELGQDRLAAVEGAAMLVGAPAIVLMLGTCITAQALDAERRLIGGAIAPGLEAQAAGVIAEVPHLREPLLEALALLRAGEMPPEIGRTTVGNLALGLAASLHGTVQALIEPMRSAVGDAPAIASGGDAELAAALQRWWPGGAGVRFDRVEPLLVLEGLRSVDW